jgi:hypothetical protein
MTPTTPSLRYAPHLFERHAIRDALREAYADPAIRKEYRRWKRQRKAAEGQTA